MREGRQMNRMTLVLLGAIGLLGALFTACSSSDKSTESSSRLSKRGESCQSSGECDTGLVCVNNKCSVGNYNLMPTGKQCVLVACHEPPDACTTPAFCPRRLQSSDT